MSALPALVAVLPLIVLGAVEEGVGYAGVHQASDGESSSWRPARRPAPDTGAVGPDGRVGASLFSKQNGMPKEAGYDPDLEHAMAESVPTKRLGFEASRRVLATHATSRDKARDIRNTRPGVQQHRVPLQNMDSVQYFGYMMIGEPPQRMKVSVIRQYVMWCCLPQSILTEIQRTHSRDRRCRRD